jgi:hypothetical protein
MRLHILSSKSKWSLIDFLIDYEVVSLQFKLKLTIVKF